MYLFINSIICKSN